MFESHNSERVLIVTTNGAIKKNGELVMGRGAALQLKRINPFIAKRFGQAITNYYNSHTGKIYGLLLLDFNTIFDKTIFGMFQVKYHYKDKASLDLIQTSAARLGVVARAFPEKLFDLNFPGIGNGGLSRKEILPIIKNLPDNVFVWELI